MTLATMPPPPVDTLRAEPMQLDWLLPEFDATLIEHRVVSGDPETVYRAVTGVDLAAIARHNPAVRGLFATRTAAERIIGALTDRPTAPAAAADEPIRLGDLPEHGEWVNLGADPPREICFGVIGRFWAGETVWETIDADRFIAFDRPGLAKIACGITLRPYGSARTLVSYEARTLGLDAESSAMFLRYWRLVWPGIAIVMRAFLRAVAEEVES
jgi:hypothetical protein